MKLENSSKVLGIFFSVILLSSGFELIYPSFSFADGASPDGFEFVGEKTGTGHKQILESKTFQVSYKSGDCIVTETYIQYRIITIYDLPVGGMDIEITKPMLSNKEIKCPPCKSSGPTTVSHEEKLPYNSELFKIISRSLQPQLAFAEGDSDPNSKGGGCDPIVIGKWGYIELGNGHECSNSPNPFDYDNDGFKEHMCYWYHPMSKILFVDFNGNKQLDNGYELLQTGGDGNALDILIESPELCTVSDCYLWQDKNSNIRVEEWELEEYDKVFKLSKITKYTNGKLTTENIYPREERKDNPRGFYIYGEAEDENLGPIYSTKPTYWMKGTR